MTYKEYFTTTLLRFNVTDADVDVIIVNQGITPTDQVDVKVAKMAIYRELSSIIPLSNISEGGYSISWNMDALKLWYRSFCNELGLVSALKPKLKNRSNLW